jgi:ABC-2 type transport system permease protein
MLSTVPVDLCVARFVRAGLTMWTIVAVGVSVTNQVAVIVIVLAFTQLVEPILRVVMGLIDWSQGI